MIVFHYHVGGRFLRQHDGSLGLPLTDLKTAGVTWVGCPWQHRYEPYGIELYQAGYGIVWTIGAAERPDLCEMALGWKAWDCEGGGDPTENARWFAGVAGPFPGTIYSGYPGVLYSGQTIQARYGCDWQKMRLAFRGGSYAYTPPIAMCGGVVGPLPADALKGMPKSLPVLHTLVPPRDDSAAELDRYRTDVRDRLRLVRPGTRDGLGMVKGVDGPKGALWGPLDSAMCRIVGEEISTNQKGVDL